MKASQVHESWAGSSSSEDTDRSICSSGRSSIKYARNISSTSSDAGQEHEHKPGQELQSRQEPPGVTDHFSDSAVPGKFERRDQLVCLWPGCRSETIFWRTADLEEHYRAVHSSNLRRFECPRSRCARKGLNGFAWADRLYEHMQFYHGHDLPKNSKRAGYSEKAKLLQPLSEISQAVTDHCFEDSKVCEHRDYSREYPRTDQEGYLLRNLERVWKSDNGEPLEPLLKSSQEIANDITGSSALLQRDPNGALESSLEGRSKKVRYSIIGRHFASLSVGSKTESNLPRLMSAEHEIPTSQIAAEGARSAASTSAEYTPEEGHFDMDVDTLVGDPPVLPVEANDFQDTHNSKSEPAINVKITHPAAMAVSLGIDELGPDGSESATEFNKQPAQRIDTHNTNNSRRFNVLLHNHVALTEWKSILSLIRKHYAEIMGPQNTGSVELLAHGNTPTVCVTCQYPERLQRTRLEDIIRPLGFPYLVGQGYIQRSGGDGVNLHTAANSSSDISGTCNQLARAFQYGPALYGHYMLRPDFGASIGVHDLAALEAARVSLGVM
ncbi:MAG: hypothetical protein M1830_000257 [Pleopsidium flavum]|nr:MAG: hypothetical protein M1830_000257 [Pleopsidium flavum]